MSLHHILILFVGFILGYCIALLMVFTAEQSRREEEQERIRQRQQEWERWLRDQGGGDMLQDDRSYKKLC